MNGNRRKIYIIVLIITIILSACKPSDKKQNDNTVEINTVETNVDNSNDESIPQEPVVNSNNESTESTEDDDIESVEPVATKEISIYSMNESTLEVEMVTALVPADSEITPQLIVDLVSDSLVDRLITVGIDSVTTEGDAVIVSFKSDGPPLTNVGSGVEDTILNAYAQSLVDNLKDKYPKVIFRKDGKAYASGHFEFGIDEVYLDGTMTK